jgi:histidyl-tRNA synthetase
MREFGWTVDLAFKGNVKKRMQRANASGAKLAIIFGDDELDEGVVKIKNLETGAESEEFFKKVPEEIGSYLIDQSVKTQ